MKIIFAIPSYFPHGTAYSTRALNLCKLLKLCGHTVIVFCDYISDVSLKTDRNTAFFDGIEIHYSSEKRTLFDRLTVKYRTLHQIKSHFNRIHPDIVFTSSVSDRIASIIRFAKKKNAFVLMECCEKFHPSNWKYGKADYRYIRYKNCWKMHFFRANGVIAISTYLQNVFQNHEIPAIRIPTILDVTNQTWTSKKSIDDDMIRFVFSGGLGGGKDELSGMIKAIADLSPEKRKRVCLNVLGPTQDAVKKQMGNDAYLVDSIKDNIMFHKRIPQQQVADFLSKNDFGVILRPNRESSNAGFPTKIGEYMQVGTPVFANETSDLGLYIRNGKNGFLLRDSSKESIEEGLEAILSLNKEQLNSMRTEARKTAESFFDYRKYKTQMDGILSDVSKRLHLPGKIVCTPKAWK